MSVCMWCVYCVPGACIVCFGVCMVCECVHVVCVLCAWCVLGVCMVCECVHVVCACGACMYSKVQGETSLENYY